MNEKSVKPGSWSRSRWTFVIALIFALHIGFIFAFGNRKPIKPRQPIFAPELSLAVGDDELLRLEDPTLFALPHVEGFSGAAWLQALHKQPEPFSWSEPPRWLPMSLERLGAAFTQFMRTNQFATYTPELKPPPQLTVPVMAPIETAASRNSTLQIEGELTSRKLLNPPSLPPQPGADLLTNTVVRVLVDNAGKVFSAVLLQPGSGSQDADRYAYGIAQSARFAPLPDNDTGVINWTEGRLVFEWRTIPVTQTNLPDVKPE